MRFLHHIKKRVAMRLFPLIALASCLMALPSLHAQAPCRDTIVRVHDSICEGESYAFHGRTIYHSGLYFDTLPRVNDTLCDSVVILRLSVLEYPETGIGKRQHCRRNIGWDLISGFPGVNYYHWTSEPDDSTLHGQERFSWIHVNPQQPTTYHLHLDYRESPPQCPFDTSISINPVVIVVAAMHAEPDEITYDDMHIIAEDFSIGTREYLWGGWAGRNWYINGVRQVKNNEWVEFYGDPSWGDTVHLMMEAYSTTCLDTAYKDIPFRRVALFFPNVFTPDRDENNLFFPHTTGVYEYELWLFDRFGLQVFHATDPSQGWDGTTPGGLRCRQGTYTWRCRYRDAITPNGYQTLTGTVTLLR